MVRAFEISMNAPQKQVDNSLKKLYIANCGCLPENWMVENLIQKHASKPFNPNIAHVFYLAGFIESWGRGIEKICDACAKEGFPAPEFVVNPGDIMVKFTALEDQIVRRPGRVTDRVTDQELEVFELLQEDPGYTYGDMAEKLSVSRKTIAERIKQLKEKSIIERVGSAKKVIGGYLSKCN